MLTSLVIGIIIGFCINIALTKMWTAIKTKLAQEVGNMNALINVQPQQIQPQVTPKVNQIQ